MSIEVVLAPSHSARLKTVLADLYNPKSASYRHWLTAGQFGARFAPSAAERSGVARYLKANGLTLALSLSPFLVGATGSSALVTGALRTNLRTFRDSKGVNYFSNVSAVQLPANLAGGVLLRHRRADEQHTARSQVARFSNGVQRGAGKPVGFLQLRGRTRPKRSCPTT